MNTIKYKDLQNDLKNLLTIKKLSPHEDGIDINIYCDDIFEEAKINWCAIGSVNEEKAVEFAYKLNIYIAVANYLNVKYDGYEIEY